MKLPRDLAVVGLGELLWDELPGGRRLGGAPANFAVMASRLGVHGILASRLGADEPGEAARRQLAGLPVDTRFLQTDADLPTGSVCVLIEDGQPTYTIHAPVAWDALQVTGKWKQLAHRADAVCWGTLAQRDPRSEQTIRAFLAETRPECSRIFDVNLRAPFYTAGAVQRSLAQATVLKLNEGEMPLVLRLTGLETAEQHSYDRQAAMTAAARRLLAAYGGLDLVAVTLGAHGSLLVTRDEVVRHPGIAAVVVDTVGAGDAFTAALAVHRLLGAPLAVQSEAANRWGAWVAGQAGAMPELPAKTLADIERQIRAAGAS